MLTKEKIKNFCKTLPVYSIFSIVAICIMQNINNVEYISGKLLCLAFIISYLSLKVTPLKTRYTIMMLYVFFLLLMGHNHNLCNDTKSEDYSQSGFLQGKYYIDNGDEESSETSVYWITFHLIPSITLFYLLFSEKFNNEK